MNLNNNNLFEDNEVTRKAITKLFCKAYNQNPNNHSDGEPFVFDNKDTDDDIINSIGNTIIENIDSNKEDANSLFQKILFFTHHQLGKITFSEEEKIYVIKKENMMHSSSEIEVANCTLMVDELVEFIQDLSVNSSLTKAETDDWDLDMYNFSTIFFKSESVRFDDKVNGYDHLIGKAYE